MAAVVESTMRELHVYGSTAADVAEGSPCKPETAKAVLAEEPGTPAGKKPRSPRTPPLRSQEAAPPPRREAGAGQGERRRPRGPSTSPRC